MSHTQGNHLDHVGVRNQFGNNSGLHGSMRVSQDTMIAMD